MTEVETLVKVPKAVADGYDALGRAFLDFDRVFRPDDGNCFQAMGNQLREFATLASSGKLCSLRGLELIHGICSAGHIALERVISWHRQPPEQDVQWLPYEVNEAEAKALKGIALALHELDAVTQRERWNGVGGGQRYHTSIHSLEMIAEPGTSLATFNTGMGTFVLQFGQLALSRF